MLFIILELELFCVRENVFYHYLHNQKYFLAVDNTTVNDKAACFAASKNMVLASFSHQIFNMSIDSQFILRSRVYAFQNKNLLEVFFIDF